MLAIISAFTEAIRLDPKFAKAYAEMANAQTIYASNFSKDTDAVRAMFAKARGNVEKALALAPALGNAHAVFAVVLERASLDFTRAQSEYGRALELSPNDVEALLSSGSTDVAMGRTEPGLSKIRKAIALDVLNPVGYMRLSNALSAARRHRDAIETANRSLQLKPGSTVALNDRGIDEMMLGDLAAAQADCNTPKRFWAGQLRMAIIYDKLHRRTEADAELSAMKASLGDSAAYQYAEIYTQWGDHPKALDWLETAFHLPDPGIVNLKTDDLIDPLRNEARFKAIEARLKFPQ